MNLIARIKQAQLTSRKQREELKSNLLTTLIGEAEAVGKAAANRTPSDTEVVAVIKKFIKNIDYIQETVDSRVELYKQAILERDILVEYLPKQLSNLELDNVISNLIAINGVDSPRKMGIVLKELKAQYDGQYDGALATKLTRQYLEN